MCCCVKRREIESARHWNPASAGSVSRIFLMTRRWPKSQLNRGIGFCRLLRSVISSKWKKKDFDEKGGRRCIYLALMSQLGHEFAILIP